MSKTTAGEHHHSYNPPRSSLDLNDRKTDSIKLLFDALSTRHYFSPSVGRIYVGPVIGVLKKLFDT